MLCPFLRKLNVKYCGLYGMKMIPLSAGSSAIERCLSREYLECRLMRDKAAVAVQSVSDAPLGGRLALKRPRERVLVSRIELAAAGFRLAQGLQASSRA